MIIGIFKLVKLQSKKEKIEQSKIVWLPDQG